MKIVVDSSAIFSGKILSSDNELFTTPSVIAEIGPGGRIRKQLEYLLAAGLNVQAPSKKPLDYIKRTAQKTGDIGRLSITDIEILALAKEINASIMSDDYSIQNLAALIGIDYIPIAQKGIKKVLIWGYKCKGCGLFYEKPQNSCKICGSELKSVKKLQL